MKRFILLFMITSLFGLDDLPSDQESSLAKAYKKGEIHLTECLSLDSSDLPSDIVLSYITDFTVTQNGYIFICDSQQNHLIVFDQAGKFIKVIGRLGKGPGDLGSPAYLATNGTHVLVHEISNRRTSVFDQEGNFIKILNSKLFSRLDRMKFLPNGELLIQTTKRNIGENTGQEKILYLLNRDLSAEKIIYQKNVLEEKMISKPIRIFVPQPFQALVSWDISPSGLIYIGFQGRYTIEVFNSRTGKETEFSHPFKPVRTTDEDRDDYFSDFVIATGNDIIKKIPDYIVDNAIMPSAKPAFYQIVIDYQGNVLVFPSLSHGDENIVFDAFMPNGRYIQTVKIGKQLINSNHLLFTQGFLWTRLLSEDEEPVLKKYMIE